MAYGNALDVGLAMDARGIVERDPRIRAASLENLGLILRTDYWWPTSVDRLYRPVTTASYLFNYSVLGNGEHAAGYHWLNLLLHQGNVWLVYGLMLPALGTAWPAFFAAALWAVHPIGTEAVTNVAGRADLLAAMSVLGGLLLYAKTRTRTGRGLWMAGGALFAIATLGVLSKENAAVLAGMMLLWDLAFPRRRNWKRLAVPYGAVLASLGVLVAARWAVFASAPWPEAPFVDNPIRAAGFWAGRCTAIKVIGWDLGLLVWPAHLSSDRAFNAIPLADFADPGFWLSLLVVGAILAAVFLRRRDSVMFWAAGFLAIALLPTSNLLFPIGSIMAERFLYLPAVGFVAAVAALAARLPNRRFATGLMVVLLALAAARTWARNPDWNSDLALDSADVFSAPGSFRVHDGLADNLDRADPRGNLDQAIREGETAWNILRVLPPEKIYQQTPAHLGLYYLAKGDLSGGAGTEGARRWYEKALAVLLRAREASQAGEKAYDQSQLAHSRPLTVRVAYQPIYLILATVYERLGRHPEAVEAALYALALDPTQADGYDALGAAYTAMGDGRRAAVTVDEKAAVLGLTPETVTQLHEVYGADSCALAGSGDATRLNLGCPQLSSDMCAAWAGLIRVFTEARIPKPIGSFQQSAAQNGCPVSR